MVYNIDQIIYIMLKNESAGKVKFLHIYSTERVHVGRYRWGTLGDLNLCLDREHLVTLVRYAGAPWTGYSGDL